MNLLTLEVLSNSTKNGMLEIVVSRQNIAFMAFILQESKTVISFKVIDCFAAMPTDFGLSDSSFSKWVFSFNDAHFREKEIKKCF
jgi:hypothetical protein